MDENRLIEKYLAGDEESLEVLVSTYLKPIYSFVYKNVGKEDDSEDITQEVFVKVWKNLKKFDSTKKFKPWIFQIAKNTSIDYLRKKKTIPFSRFQGQNGKNILEETLASKPQNLIETLSDKKTLQTAKEELSKKELNIIKMRNEDGLSFREIAETSNESINTIKSRYRRTLSALKKIIKNKEKRDTF